MGDILDDEQFLVDASDDENSSGDGDDHNNKVDYLVESGDDDSQGGDASDSDEDGVDTDNIDQNGKKIEKKRKRADKFADMKAKRRKYNEAKLEEEAQKLIVQEHESEATMQLQPEEMLFLIEDARRRHRLVSEEFASLRFEPQHFFYPAMEATAVTESANKKLSPFVRALSVTMPNYRKLLTAEGGAQVKSEDFGSPLVVIVTASAIRATEIIKGLHAKIHHCKIAKLFGKHIKITEQIALLASSYHPIVIGTPHRLHQLIEFGALSLNKTQLCMIDFTADSKSFSILTLAGVNQDFGKFMFQYAHSQRDHIRFALIKDKPLASADDTAAAAAVDAEGQNKKKKSGLKAKQFHEHRKNPHSKVNKKNKNNNNQNDAK